MGKFYNLFIDNKVKLKELIVAPGKGMSLQHFHRDEIWFISQGECIVNFSEESPDQIKKFHLKKHDSFSVKKMNGIRSPIPLLKMQNHRSSVR